MQFSSINSNRFSIYEKEVHDLDNPPSAFILNTGINPKGLPDLGGNGCCVIQHNPDNNEYTAQLAFSFGSDKIAIRRKRNTGWTNWAYFFSSTNSKPLMTESTDLNNASGGFTILHWKLQTANAPRTEGLTTASSGIVLSYIESANWAVQFGMIPADKKWYVRVKSNNEWSRWEEK